MTELQYQRVLARLTKLENTMNDLITAHQHFITALQVTELLTITQAKIEELRITTESLVDRVEVLEEEPYEDRT